MAKKKNSNIITWIKDVTGSKAEGKAYKWLLPAETGMMLYSLFTLLLIAFTYTSLPNADELIWWRIRIMLLTVALWIVYRIWTCPLMNLARILLLLLTLGWWYPDTYLLNRHFDNLDHIFAAWDQALFGFQPALVWSKAFPSPIVSELMAMGYSLYFLMFVSLITYIFIKRYKDFQKTSFIIITSFFVYYVVFDLLPVAGPQYYYLAVGVEDIAAGHFPALGNYFADHTECLPIPGWQDGLFHNLVQASHDAGERPTAAFPSSHVGISTITMLMALRLRMWKYLLLWAVPYAFLCMGTVYLLPHYAVDAMAGFITAIAVFFTLEWTWKKVFAVIRL